MYQRRPGRAAAFFATAFARMRRPGIAAVGRRKPSDHCHYAGIEA